MRKKTKWDEVINEITSHEVGELIMEKKRDDDWLKAVEKEKEVTGGKQPAAPDDLTFTIVMDKAGKISISGPLFDRILCLGMLDYAKHLVLQWRPKPGTPQGKGRTKGAFGK